LRRRAPHASRSTSTLRSTSTTFECLRIGLQAANGSNQQSWRWLVIADPVLRGKIAELYRDAYLLRVGGQMLAAALPAGTPEGRLMSSTEWLVENMAKVPLLVIPC
jgi:nitroreductase